MLKIHFSLCLIDIYCVYSIFAKLQILSGRIYLAKAWRIESMSSYKLTYFPVRGLGEFLRLILHYAKVSFEDNRIAFEDWPSLKESKSTLVSFHHYQQSEKLSQWSKSNKNATNRLSSPRASKRVPYHGVLEKG
jgi:transcriptional antiterminator Rof (Rho-off)